jgi:ubiquinone/menaquinone biosynthesis C-methylase UbiE
MLNRFLRLLHKPIYDQRLRVLANKMVVHLHANDKVLDIGCGSGMLGEAILKHADCPDGIAYYGVERAKRGGEPIEVIEYKSGSLPFLDGAFNLVILADVLHHEKQENFLLREAARVSKGLLLVKDHKPEGVLGFWRTCFLDWAANNPHGVKCLYRYHTTREWRSMFRDHSLIPIHEDTSIDLYPPVINALFGRRLQYFAVLRKQNSNEQ